MFIINCHSLEKDSWSMFWPMPIYHYQRIILEFDVSPGGGRGLGETSQKRFSGQNR